MLLDELSGLDVELNCGLSSAGWGKDVIMFKRLKDLLFGKKHKKNSGFGIEILPSDGIDVVPRAKLKWKKGADNTAYYAELADGARRSFENVRRRAECVGAKYYIWRTSGDSDVCEACNKKNGKRVRFDKPPVKTGHPGSGKCCPNGHCRCFASPVLPR